MKRLIRSDSYVGSEGYEWDDSHCTDVLQDAYDNDDFFDIENDVATELGLYLDFSSVRGNGGNVYIFSDPDHECQDDMWCGDMDDAIAVIPFSKYAKNVCDKVFRKPDTEWESAYKDYIASVISETQE